MSQSYRALRHLGTAILAAALFLLISVNPLAQSNQLPLPTSHVSDLAGVIDARTRNRLENVLEGLKEKSNIDLYVAVVDSTGGLELSAFSQQLARDWNIGSKNGRNKTLLLVVSAATKTSFTQFTRMAQVELPEGVLGEMSYRMSTPLSEGRFAEAVDGGVQVFVNALAEKLGFKAADLDRPPAMAATSNSGVTGESPQPVLVSATNVEKTRPRTVSDVTKLAAPTPTPPDEAPRAEPTPTETPAPEPTPSETPAPEPTPTETPAPEPTPSETPAPEPTPSETPRSDPLTVESSKTETSPAEPPKIGASTSRKKEGPPAKLSTGDTRKPTAEPVEEEDEVEAVELTLTLPLPQRAVKLKEFLDTHPDSKVRTRATELLISTHAGLGDQQLKNGDTAGGIEQMLRAIDEADVGISDKLFSGVISQIPTNLYMRGERAAALRAAENVEAKFGADPKRLLAVAGFYLEIERGSEAIRIAETAVKLAPDMAEAHRILALGLHISLRLEEAAAEYKRTLELDPTSKVSRGSLADLYRAAGKTKEALALYDEQLTADPRDRAARAGKVISLFELARNEEANRELESALADDPRNLPLLTGAAYWLAAHENSEKAFELARQAVAIEPRYTWAQIAFVRSLLGLKRPLEAERAMRFVRQYGKFPTLTYELANVLSSMGLYEEAAEVLRESFAIKDGQIQADLAGHLPASAADFLQLLAPERRAGIYQATSADSAADARMMKALLAFNLALTPVMEGSKVDEALAVAAAREFAAGTDNMRAFRQIYAASRLLRSGIGIATAFELASDARKAISDALNVSVLTIAAQADEFRELRARAIASGNVPDVAEAPHDVVTRILKGRVEDLAGWALFNQEKYPEAINHLQQASEVLPAGTPSWRSALWHLGVALEQSGQKEQALDYYIKSYYGGEGDGIRRSVIEQLYRKVNGSLDGLDARIGASLSSGTSPALTTPTPIPDETSTKTLITPEITTAASPDAERTTSDTTSSAEPPPAETPKSEAASSAAPETPPAIEPVASESPQPTSDASLRNAASRLRSTVKIAGRILDSNNLGLANVVVVLISPSGTVLASTTDTEGNYLFTVAPSQKTYRVIPSKEGYTFTPIDKAFAGLIEDQKEIDFVGAKP